MGLGRLRARPALAALVTSCLLALGVSPAIASTPTPPQPQWQDVQPGSRAWFAKDAINGVAAAHDWMRDYGTATFHPTTPETREQLARAVVRAFAPTVTPKPSITFNDLTTDDPFFPYANVAVAKGWMSEIAGGFQPDVPVTEFMVSKALVMALGLQADVSGANGIHLHDATPLPHPPQFGVYLIGRVLGLWYNHDSRVKGDGEAFDLLPTTPVPRDDVAYALSTAVHLGADAHWYADQYADFDVGSPSAAIQQLIEFGMKYVGYPYVYAGEWNTPTISVPYCCGAQLQGGFDCSGFTWWLLRAGDSMWNNDKIRGYPGWILNERSSYEMAGAMKKWQRVAFDRLQPGDIMLYGSSKDPGSVYHVDTFIGNGWALDSGGDGVAIVNVSSGWYRDTFQYGRRLKPASS